MCKTSLAVSIRLCILVSALFGVVCSIFPLLHNNDLKNKDEELDLQVYFAANVLGMALFAVIVIVVVISFSCYREAFAWPIALMCLGAFALICFIVAFAEYYKIYLQAITNKVGITSWLFGALVCAVEIVLPTLEMLIDH